jgi:hypothetical protein
MPALENGNALETSKDRLNARDQPVRQPRLRRRPVRWTLELVRYVLVKPSGKFTSFLSNKANSISLFLRLYFWYALLTCYFRCPSQLAELEESSSHVCKPYIMMRSSLEPHLLPYYQTYAAPYVNFTRPYARTLNEHIYSPASNIVRHNFNTYGAPYLKQAQEYSKKKWQAEVIPQLRSVQENVIQIYKLRAEPHIRHVANVMAPYSAVVGEKVAQVNNNYFLPVYVHTRPLISRTYSAGHDVIAGTAMPFVKRVWFSIVFFANSAVWPRITSLYSENVEPQLVKIGERLATYPEGRRLRSTGDDLDR